MFDFNLIMLIIIFSPWLPLFTFIIGDEKMEQVEYIYIGRQLSSSGKLNHSYQKSTDGRFVISFKNKLNKTDKIGFILQFKKGAGEVVGPYEVIGVCQDKTKISAWIADDKLTYSKYVADKALIKLQTDSDLYPKTVTTLNAIISELPSNQRRAFVFRLLSDLKF